MASAPYPARMMRDSPPELARLLPGPYASSSRTRSPRFRKCQAVQAPNTPAPTTATSKLFVFRPGQDEVIRSVIDGRNTLAVMPTGAGKSLCYQLASLYIPGATVVASPLISLMKDQVDKLDDLGLPADQVSSA